jgi:alkylated DNA repair dioxygenase AlkB
VKPNHHGPPELPEGFSYREGFLSEIEEQELLKRFEGLEFRAFDFHGYIAKRRIVEYGFEYDFSSRRATVTHAFPEFLEPFKKRAAEWAALAPDDLVEAVITEYTEGSPIGWHRDVPKFETIVGVSLNSSCRMRFKPYKGQGTIVSIMLEPRSAYLLRGPARWNYQHSIPAVQALRHSITFRTLSKKRELS